MGTQSAAVAEFVTAQVTSALGGLTTFLENAEVTSQAAAAGHRGVGVRRLRGIDAQGASPLEAIKQITPVLEQARRATEGGRILRRGGVRFAPRDGGARDR